MATPAKVKPDEYDSVMSYKVPAMGGPISEAIPWNKSSKPKAFLNFSRSNKSTNDQRTKTNLVEYVGP